MRGTWVVVHRQHVFLGEKCPLCGEKAKANEVVYVTRRFTRTSGAESASLRVVQHKVCLEAILQEEIPTTTDEVKFGRIRDAIVASGDIYAEVS